MRRCFIRKINDIIIHCSATEQNKDFRASDIDRWHRNQGWQSIGYHYVICLDGTIENGRDITLAGAHCKGHNKDSVGICLIGGIKDGTKNEITKEYTKAQWDSLKQLVTELKEKYPEAKVVGHCDYEPNKTCPNFDVGQWAKENNII